MMITDLFPLIHKNLVTINFIILDIALIGIIILLVYHHMVSQGWIEEWRRR